PRPGRRGAGATAGAAVLSGDDEGRAAAAPAVFAADGGVDPISSGTFTARVRPEGPTFLSPGRQVWVRGHTPLTVGGLKGRPTTGVGRPFRPSPGRAVETQA